jgi:hypothetical protein
MWRYLPQLLWVLQAGLKSQTSQTWRHPLLLLLLMSAMKPQNKSRTVTAVAAMVAAMTPAALTVAAVIVGQPLAAVRGAAATQRVIVMEMLPPVMQLVGMSMSWITSSSSSSSSSDREAQILGA